MQPRDSDYFPSYEDLKVHNLMLKDKARVEAYKNAILSSSELFKGKVVLDVGAGTGILSIFCAKAGASRVYAVEAASNLIPLLKDNVAENKLTDKITVINAEIENIKMESGTSELSEVIPEYVDIIVSEWMGFYLLHEGMIDSVISARRFLKSGGLMFPDKCTIYAALCELPDYHDIWNNFHGLSMSNFGKMFRSSLQSEPQIFCIKEESLISKPIEILSFETTNVTEEELKIFSRSFVVPASRDGKYQGLCIWFTVSFPSPENIMLSTSPSSPKTHWKQTVIVFIEGMSVEQDEPVAFDLMFRKSGLRSYEITYSSLDPEDVKHPTPCECYNMKCQVIKAFLQSQCQE